MTAVPSTKSLGSISTGQQRFPRGLTILPLAIPAMIGAALVLGIYADTAAHWMTVVRPLLFVGVIGAGAAAVVRIFTRQQMLATAAGSLAVTFGLGDELLGWVIVELYLSWLTVRQWRRVRRTPPLVAPMKAITTIAAIIFGVAMANLGLRGTVTLQDFSLEAPPRISAASQASHPNIYVLLLDAYARADTLADLGYDNEPFLDELSGMGFTVYSNAHADYRRTELSLVSMLSDELHELETIEYPEWPAIVNTWRTVRRDMFDSLPAVHSLRSAGYRLTYVASPIGHTDLPGWDERIDTGQLTGLEVEIIQRSPLGPALGEWVLDQHRERIEASIDAWAAQAHRPGQHAVLAHVLAPHTPFVFQADGSRRAPLECWSLRWCSIYQSTASELHLSDGEYAEMLFGQITYLNRLILEATNDVIASDPRGIVVLLSDHGARYSDEPSQEWHRSFLAARIPGHPDALSDDPGPDRLFLRLLETVATHPS